MRKNISLDFSASRGYIAHPYWPSREKVINIQKESGMNRTRSARRREEALTNHLKSLQMSQDQYDILLKQASRSWYLWSDVVGADPLNSRNPDEIVIPAHQLYGLLAQASSIATSSIRLSSVQQIRTILTISDFSTGKLKADGLWERFVVVNAGPGGRLSNQRSLRADEYIHHFTAKGYVSFSEDIVNWDKVLNFLTFAGREIGVGASRKMGWGRFEVEFA